MRTRVGNPHNEAHGQPMRVIEWIAPAGVDVQGLAAKLETAVVGLGLKLYHRGDNQQNGFVSSSVRPDGSVYVAIHLYQQGCNAPNCPTGHVPVLISAAPNPTPAQLTAIVTLIGEHPSNVLTGSATDTGLLQGLGFRPANPAQGFPGDAPFRP